MGITVPSLLRINGHPGHYVRIAGHWRLEEVGRGTQSLTPTNNSSSSFPYCPESLWEAQLSPIARAKGSLGSSVLLSPVVPPQRLHHRPLHPDGCHHAAQTDH